MSSRARSTTIYNITATMLIAIVQDSMKSMKHTYPQVDVIDFLITVAVLVGCFEGRPMNHTKLATFTGISRPTVVRRVKTLVANRILEFTNHGKSITTPTYRIMGDGPTQLANKFARYVKNAAAELNKMDT